MSGHSGNTAEDQEVYDKALPVPDAKVELDLLFP